MRLNRFYTTVGTSCLWGAGGWELTTDTMKMLRSFEQWCLRQIVKLRRKTGETYVDFYKRGIRVGRTVRDQDQIPSLTRRALMLQHRWAGHLARMPPDCQLARVWKWRDRATWNSVQGKMFRLDPRNNRAWKHRQGHAAKQCWGTGLDAVLGPNWTSTAQNRSSWRKTEGKYIYERLKELGLEK